MPMPESVGLDRARMPRNTFPIVGVGASAGGLEAFRKLLAALPLDTGMAYVLVQHLDPRHRSNLAELLARGSRMAISEIKEDVAVEPNHVYVTPGQQDVTIRGGMLKLVPRTRTRGQHMPIDSFLRTLAEAQGSKAIGVILSGTATDGTLGVKAIKAEGGIVFAQDPGSAAYDGMPRSAIASGCVDFVLPPDAIAEELSRLSRHPYVVRPPREERANDAAFGAEGEGWSHDDPGPASQGDRRRLQRVQAGDHQAEDRAAHGARPRREAGGLRALPRGRSRRRRRPSIRTA